MKVFIQNSFSFLGEGDNIIVAENLYIDNYVMFSLMPKIHFSSSLVFNTTNPFSKQFAMDPFVFISATSERAD